MRTPSVLVVDDRRNWRELALELLEPKNLDVDVAATYDEAKDRLRRKRPPYDVLVVDVRLNDSDPHDTTGIDITSYALELSGYTNAIIWTAYPNIDTARRAFRDLHVVDYIEKNPRAPQGGQRPFDRKRFQSLVCRAATLAHEIRQEQSILIVDNDKYWVDKTWQILEDDGYMPRSVTTYSDALNELATMPSTIAIVEICLQNGNADEGLRFVNRIGNANPETRVIILTEGGTKRTVRNAFKNHRVVDYLLKSGDGGFSGDDLRQAVRDALRSSSQLYVVTEFTTVSSDESLQIGAEYVFSVIARRTVSRVDRAVSIWLSPSRIETNIEVAVYVSDDSTCADITPTYSQLWRVPSAGPVNSLRFGVIPRRSGVFVLHTELSSEEGWWRRLATPFVVADVLKEGQ